VALTRARDSPEPEVVLETEVGKVQTSYFGAEKKLSRAVFSSHLPGTLALIPGLDTLLYFALIALKQMSMSPCGFDHIKALLINAGTV
jgi:hypothetical protein